MKQYIPYCILILLTILLLLQCEKNAGLTTQYQTNFNALGDSITYYKNALGNQTASIMALEADKNTIEILLLDKDAELKALAQEFTTLRYITKVNSNINIDTIAAPFNTPIVTCDSSQTFKRTGNISTKWYNLNYRVTSDTLKISSFNMASETSIVTGFKRKWFLGKQTLITDVTISNPYISVTDIKAAEVVVPEPWYKKWYVWLVAGMVTGMALK